MARFVLSDELLKIAISGMQRFSPPGAELLRVNPPGFLGGQAGAPQEPASPPPMPLPAAPAAPAAVGDAGSRRLNLDTKAPTGYVSERLTKELGGEVKQFSRQALRSTEDLEAQIKSRGLDLDRYRGLIRQMKGTETPEGYNAALNISGFESGGFNPNARGDVRKGVTHSFGLGQINVDSHPEWKGREKELFDPWTSLGEGVKAWNTQGPEKAYKASIDRFGGMKALFPNWVPRNPVASQRPKG
jgi:hypothetical protein